jgi:hypothetical protein
MNGSSSKIQPAYEEAADLLHVAPACCKGRSFMKDLVVSNAAETIRAKTNS